MEELIPKDFKNYYDRLNDHLPSIYNEGKGGKGYNIDIHDAKLAYSDWMEEVLKIIAKLEGISKKKKELIRQIVNASDLDNRRIKRERESENLIKSLRKALAKKDLKQNGQL